MMRGYLWGDRRFEELHPVCTHRNTVVVQCELVPTQIVCPVTRHVADRYAKFAPRGGDNHRANAVLAEPHLSLQQLGILRDLMKGSTRGRVGSLQFDHDPRSVAISGQDVYPPARSLSIGERVFRIDQLKARL